MATSPIQPSHEGSNEPLITRRFEDYVFAHAREHEMLAEAVNEAKGAQDRRLDGMNELRAQIQTERGSYQSRVESDLLRVRNEERLNKLEQDVAAVRSAATTWVGALGIFFTIMQLALYFLVHATGK